MGGIVFWWHSQRRREDWNRGVGRGPRTRMELGSAHTSCTSPAGIRWIVRGLTRVAPQMSPEVIRREDHNAATSPLCSFSFSRSLSVSVNTSRSLTPCCVRCLCNPLNRVEVSSSRDMRMARTSFVGGYEWQALGFRIQGAGFLAKGSSRVGERVILSWASRLWRTRRNHS